MPVNVIPNFQTKGSVLSEKKVAEGRNEFFILFDFRYLRILKRKTSKLRGVNVVFPDRLQRLIGKNKQTNV